MSISDAQYRRWLERSAKAPRCALFELTFLGATDSSLVPGEHKVYVSNMPYITGGDDTPAHQEFDYCVLEEPSFTRRMGEQLEGRSTQSFGELILSNECTLGEDGQLLEAGVRDDWLYMNWDGRQVRMWLGDPGWPFTDFRLVLNGRIVDIFDHGGYKIGFRIGDKASLLDRPVMTTVLGGDGPEAGHLMPLAYGHTLHNIRPRLIDRVDQVYRISMTDPGLEELWTSPTYFENPFRVRENGVPLSNGLLLNSSVAATDLLSTSPTPHGYVADTRLSFDDTGTTLPAPLVAATNYWVIASGLTTTDFKVSATRGGSAIDITGAQTGTPFITSFGWTSDTAAGTFQLAGNPIGTITCDCWGLGTTDGFTQTNTAAAIMYEALTSGITNRPLDETDIDTDSREAFHALCPQKLGIYITERMTFAELFDRCVLSVGGWWGFSRDGLLQFGRLDLPDSAAVPVYSFNNDDVARRSMKLIRRILPRAEIKLRGQINWNPQETTAGSLDSYERDFYARPYEEVTGQSLPLSWEDDPAQHISAARPEPPLTLFSNSTGSAEMQAEADRRAELMQEPDMIYGFDSHQAVYLLKIGDPVEVEHPKYTGTVIVVAMTERVRGRSQIEVFCRKAPVHPAESIPGPPNIWIPPGGPYTLISSQQTYASNNAASSSAFSAINTVEHDFIVVGFASAKESAPTITVSDTAGNTYTLTTADTGGTGSIQWAYCFNALPHASNVITVNHPTGATYRSMFACQFTGGSRTLDTQGAAYDATTSTTLATAAFSTTGVGVVLAGYTNPDSWGNFTSATFAGPETTTTLPGTMQQGNWAHMLGTGAHAAMQMTASGCRNAAKIVSAIAFR